MKTHCSGEDGHQIRHPQHDVVGAIGALELTAGVLGVEDGAACRDDGQRDPAAFLIQGTWANRYDLSSTNKHCLIHMIMICTRCKVIVKF